MSLNRLILLSATVLCVPLTMACIFIPPVPDAADSDVPEAVVDGDLPETVRQRTRSEMADALGVAVDTIDVVGYSQETWSDSCLGLGGPAESCLFALTEGWRVQVTHPASDTTYSYRTDLTGSSVRLQPETDN